MESLYAEYVSLRASGMRPSAALDTLRDRIELLIPNEKLALVRAVRHYEDAVVQTMTTQFRPTGAVAPALFEDDGPGPMDMDDIAKLTAENGDTTVKLPENLRKKVDGPAVSLESDELNEPNDPHYLACPNCGNMVLIGQLQCPTCYYVMPEAGPIVEEPVAEVEDADVGQETTLFEPESTLVLTSRDGRRLFARPQDRLRETIVGRTDGKTFTADLDLSPLGAATLGVSRVHAALAYDARRGIMTISDMNSMNGTFLNGLRLQPQEIHDLQPGDQLRFGRLSVRLSFENR